MIAEQAFPRKAPAIETRRGKRFICRALAETIIDLAREAYTNPTEEEIIRRVSRRLGIPTVIVDRSLAGFAFAKEREAAALRYGVLGALEAANEASRDTWREAANAA